MSEHLTDEEILEIQEQGATDDWGGGPARKALMDYDAAVVDDRIVVKL